MSPGFLPSGVKRIIKIGLWIGAVLLVPLVFVIRQNRCHYVGAGADTPEDALCLFTDAMASSDYLVAREVIYYRPFWFCGEFDTLALNPDDPKALALCVEDHIPILSIYPPDIGFHLRNEKTREAYKQMWCEHLPRYRQHLLYYLETFKSLKVNQTDSDTIKVSYPALIYCGGQVRPSSDQTYEIQLIKVKGRWYFNFFNCTQIGVKDLPPED